MISFIPQNSRRRFHYRGSGTTVLVTKYNAIIGYVDNQCQCSGPRRAWCLDMIYTFSRRSSKQHSTFLENKIMTMFYHLRSLEKVMPGIEAYQATMAPSRQYIFLIDWKECKVLGVAHTAATFWPWWDDFPLFDTSITCRGTFKIAL